MSKLRSPSYPTVSLPEAIAKARMVYEKEFTHPAPREVMVKSMGYGGINGASGGVFSAVLKYGLLEGVGNEQYKISEDAIDIIIHSKGDVLRRKAIEKTAFSHPLFAEFQDSYGKSMPSEENLNAYLIKKGFNPKITGDIIRNYRDTLELVKDETESYNSISEQNVSREGKTNMFQNQPQNIAPVTPPANQTIGFSDNDAILSFNLSRISQAKVIFNGQVTQEAIRKLRTLLEVTEDTYPTQAELEQPKQATWRNKDFDAPVSVTGEAGEKDGKKYYSVEGSNTAIAEDELDFGDN